VCSRCPIWRECLYTALDSGEHGVWGGASERTRRQYVKRAATYNMRAVNRGMVDGRRSATEPAARTMDAYPKPRTDRRIDQLAGLGVTSADVRYWATTHGVPVTPKGLPSLTVIDAYAQAQRAA
jgi:hypothetical protein